KLVGLTKRFGDLTVVDDLTLKVHAGEFVTILGPSGSGKTTALNMVAGFVSPSSGDVLIDDRPITHLAIEQRNLSMVFQGYALFPHMTVAENVGFPLRMKKWTSANIAKKVSSALDLVQLEQFATRYPRQLSGGQRQRVALARAIISEPPLLLMDEPLGALDLKLRGQMQGEIRSLHRKIGCTVISVTHDQDEAMTLSDRIVIMERGRIVQAGRPREIYDTPNSMFAAAFVGDTNLIPIPSDIVDITTVQPALIDRCLTLPVEHADISTRLALSIRPSAFRRVDPDLQPTAGRLIVNGTVGEVQFLGDAVRYAVTLTNGRVVRVKEARRAGVDDIVDDSHISISVSCDDVVIVNAR
ncbi:MAG: ABC transporter ATP-binding protein, partial [Xanthobacteraceae bacterium]